MAGIITFGGLATGLDTNRIIDQLVRLERRPIDLLDQQVAAVQATQSSIGTLQAKLATLRGAAAALRTVDDVLVRQASSSDETVLGAAAGAGAARGSTTISVLQLAHGSVAGSQVGLASASATVASGPGTFQFQVGGGDVHQVAVDATTTLQDLAGAINDANAGVTAAAVNVGTAASPDFRLVLQSTASGASSTITILQDDTSLAVQTTQAGQNAKFTVQGFSATFERESNSFSDVLPGVTFTAKAVGTATVTVDDDTKAIVEKARALATAFNDIVTFVAGQSNIQESADKNALDVGSLATDITARRIVDRLHTVFSEVLAGATGAKVNLSSLGFATQRDGTILFDEGKFTAALASDAAGTAQVFAGNGVGAGIANDLATLIDGLSGAGGTLTTHSSALSDQLHLLQDQIDTSQRAVDTFEQGLREQFNALESFVNGLQSQSQFLSQLFTGR